ncbi:hypothetical protein BD289DRAFT_462222 [Coniella lustricola]|uniref:Myb-like domain-containing protein n=1 Tax=Coniella lustricola TaxID=2025994 RepID=A0A2T3A1I9_9PEZI|nr:hypothetical protein BD289DRAFT_462222 [Coniella lustricola]
MLPFLLGPEPHGAPTIQILSIQIPAPGQSGSLWRNACSTGTLAGNYRLATDYHVDYSPQGSHPADQSQQHHGYASHHPRASMHHTGPSILHESPTESHYTTMQQQQQQQQQQHHHHHQQPAHRAVPVLMDPGQMGGHPVSPHSVVSPLYPSMATGPSSGGLKRSRPDDLDLSVHGMTDLDQGDMGSMQQTPLSAAYAQAAASAHPTHHHHRLPDTGPPSKIIRRDDGSGGGAPSVVGQEGMPAPAQRPRGPKLKFTPEDDQLLIDLKENKNLTWKQIADFFPGRSSGTLQVRYCTKLKAKTTQWTDETDQKLRSALQDYENEKWRIVANKIGTGFTPAACRERAEQLAEGVGGDL